MIILGYREEQRVQAVADQTGRDVWFIQWLAFEGLPERQDFDFADAQQGAWNRVGSIDQEAARPEVGAIYAISNEHRTGWQILSRDFP
jgi:hypothetical protein